MKQNQLNRIEAAITALQSQMDTLTKQFFVLVEALDEDGDAEPMTDLDGNLTEVPPSIGSSLDEDGDAA
ncbi:hypothetical protein IPU70_01770 [Achromobacter sp. SD115]|uniref:hypothetical protein n=1 Tax=Achromobacter sp. SD115 TaxID=2782011 RepID=UPI001A978F6A|nr:hypothetical protein [Achromobacter sp. SD115]MBO1012260.1 hypothetical protein [Achromobacter sp. SD115]